MMMLLLLGLEVRTALQQSINTEILLDGLQVLSVREITVWELYKEPASLMMTCLP